MTKFCPDCGDKLTKGNKCNNCGLIVKEVVTELVPEEKVQVIPVIQNVPEVEGIEEERKRDVCSIVGFCLAIANLFTCGILGLPALVVSIVGYIFVIVNDSKGKFFAEVGIILSLVVTTLALVFLILMSGS